MILRLNSDGSGEDALAQAVAQHRAGFCANFDLQAGADFADTAPAPAEACTDIGAEPHRARKRKSRPYAVIAFVVFIAASLGGAHLYASLKAEPAVAKPRLMV
jgi:hypothetical protein